MINILAEAAGTNIGFIITLRAEALDDVIFALIDYKPKYGLNKDAQDLLDLLKPLSETFK